MQPRTFLLVLATCLGALAQESLPPLTGDAPQSVEAMWAGFDPQAEPLDVEVLTAWEEDGVVMQVLRYRIAVFKGRKAMMGAVWGFPKGAKGLPGLVQIHGGGQYADYQAVLTNAKRGYATISVAWAGRISAPGYRVDPTVVKLFWEGKTEDPNYKVTTDWGALDAFHAPSREKGTVFPSTNPTKWTIDAVESPRNSPWFLCALGARRALTFLEQQPQVDPDRLGVYGHSMGGKLTVMTTAADPRVKAAAPSCGGISDRGNKSELFRATIGDDAQLPHISCPIVFLSPANDFHGRINDLPRSLAEIASEEWRVTCAPHHNHQDTKEYEVATQLWFDQHLKGSFEWPETPTSTLKLDTQTKVPLFSVTPDRSRTVEEVDVFFTQQGVDSSDSQYRLSHINRHWHHAMPKQVGDRWFAHVHVYDKSKPLWVYANVRYGLKNPVSGAGYYYGRYTTKSFNLSSLIKMVSPKQLQAAGVKVTVKPTPVIETFSEGWQKEWFNYKGHPWSRNTHKVYHPLWKGPAKSELSLQVQSSQPNTLVVGIDAYAAELKLKGGLESHALKASDFRDATGTALANWAGIKELRIIDTEHLRKGIERRLVGKRWQGDAPVFRSLSWQPPQTDGPETMWTYKEIDGKALQLSVFLPDDYADGKQFPTFVVFHGGSWNAGTPSWHYPDCEYWSKRGMIAVSVDYRLKDRDQIQVPLECVKDAKSAIRYLRANAESLKVDPDRIVAAGGSAGGHLAAATATIADAESAISCKPNAIVLYNPWFKCADALNPRKQLGPGLPPIITFAGGQDPGIPVAEMRDFHTALQAIGGNSTLCIGKTGKHGFCNGRNPRNPFFYWSLELADRFLIANKILAGTAQVTRPHGVQALEPNAYEIVD